MTLAAVDIEKLTALRLRAEDPAAWRPWPRIAEWIPVVPTIVDLPGSTWKLLISFEIQHTAAGLQRVGRIACGSLDLRRVPPQIRDQIISLLGFSNEAEIKRSEVAEVLRITEAFRG